MTRPNSSDFDRLRKLIEHGWCKLNTDGSHTYVGESPYYDLYWAVRALDQRFPVQPSLDPIFLKLAHTIAELYPERVREPMGSAEAVISYGSGLTGAKHDGCLKTDRCCA
jgi:hypothetical protein